MTDMAGAVVRDGRRVEMDMAVAGEPGRASVVLAGATSGKGAGGRSPGTPGTPGTPEGWTARLVREEPTARAVPGWAFRPSGALSGRAPAGGAEPRGAVPSVGPASAGLPGAASGPAPGRGLGQRQGTASVGSAAAISAPSAISAASRRRQGAVPETPAVAGMLDGVRRRLAESGADPTPARVAQALREQGRVLGDAEILGAAEQLRSELVGSGPLDPLLADPSVTDVLVSAPDRVWVDRGGGLELAPVAFPDAGAVRRLAQRLATVAGRRLDDARPWVDARLPDGTRLHAVLPPVAVDCTCLSLRVVRPRAFTLDELAAAGTVPPGGDRVLCALVRARLSFLVSGGTGSGKTTLLSALLGLVGPDERIVLAEDSAELRPDHAHVVRLETRPANQEGAGLVTLEDLVRQALRMRPDRLVVGEVRGPEVAHLLAALNTGHSGCGTVHANAAADVPARLEALGTAAGLDRAALHSQLAAALSVVLHLVRDRTGRRRIAEVHVLERDPSGLVRTVPALRWGAEAFVAERGWPRLRELLRAPGLEERAAGRETQR